MINNKNYKGGKIRVSCNVNTVRISVVGTTEGGNTVVSNFDFPAEDAAGELAEWAQVLRDYWWVERKRRIEAFRKDLYAADMHFRISNNVKDTVII